MDWNENDYHCGQSAVHTQGPDTAVQPISLTASRPTPLNESLNESDAISQDPVQAIRGLLNETVVLRHRFRDVMGESTNSPVPAFAQRGDEQPVRTVYERLRVRSPSTLPAASATGPGSAA
jgi:hypothetical protein